jgi:hypothetical protein
LLVIIVAYCDINCVGRMVVVVMVVVMVASVESLYRAADISGAQF